MDFARLPLRLQGAILDHLEPDDLIALHRTTRSMRLRLNERGFLPGRVAKLHIMLLAVPSAADQLLVKGIYVMVESREGARICTGYPHKRLYHCLEKEITPDEVVPGYPKFFESWNLKHPMRRYRMKKKAYSLGIFRLLQKIHSIAELSIEGDDTGIWPLQSTPFHGWLQDKLYARPGLVTQSATLQCYAKSRPIEVSHVLRAIRWMGKCWCRFAHETLTPLFIQTIGGRPEVFQVTGAAMIRTTRNGLTCSAMMANTICRDSFEPWPTRAFIWEDYGFEESLQTVWELLPRSPSIPPGLLITHFGGFEPIPEDPVEFATNMLVEGGLKPLQAFQEFGVEKGTRFFQWPNAEKEVLLQLRYHEPFPEFVQKSDPHVTITIWVVPSWNPRQNSSISS